MNKNFTHCKIFLTSSFIAWMHLSIIFTSPLLIKCWVLHFKLSYLRLTSVHSYLGSSLPHMNSLLGRWICHASGTYYVSQQMSSAILFSFSGGYFCCSYRRSTPLTTGEQSFHMCMNLCSTISSFLNWVNFLSLFPRPFPFWTYDFCAFFFHLYLRK